MPKYKTKSSYTLYSLFVPVFIVLAFVATSGYLMYKENTAGKKSGYVLAKKTENNSNSSKTDNNSNGNSNKSSTTNKSNPSNKEKTDNKPSNESKSEKVKSNPGLNSYIYKTEVKKVKTKLAKVAEDEDMSGNQEASDEIEEVVTDIDSADDDTEEAIEAVESRPGWKNFIIGSDYKNLGALRSQLVQNRNNIRKLNQTMNKVQGEDNQLMLQEQLQVLEQEQERLQTIIKDNEEGFSLLGWAFRLLSGYNSDDPLDDGDDGIDDETPESSESTESIN